MCLNNCVFGGRDNSLALPDSESHNNVVYKYVEDVRREGEFTVMHLNIHSLHKNLDNLVEMLHELEKKKVIVDILLLCETWLNKDNCMLLNIHGYLFYHKSRQNVIGGGVVIYVREGLAVSSVADLDCFKEGVFESIFLGIKREKDELLVGEIYRVPNTSEVEFLALFKDIMDKLKNKNCIIGSDQNMDLFKSSTHKPTLEFLNNIYESGLIPTILKPTRVTHQSCTLIDNIYVSVNLAKDHVPNVVLDYMSDHFPCLVQLKITKVQVKELKTVVTQKITEPKMCQIKSDLVQNDWLNELKMENGVNANYELFAQKLQNSLNKHCPEKTCKISTKNCLVQPWMTVSLLKCSRKSKRLYKLGVTKGKSSNQWQRYCTYVKSLNMIKKHVKKDYFMKEIESYRGDSRKLWKLINVLLKGQNDKSSIIREINGKNGLVRDPTGICNELNDHFATVGSKVAEKIKPVSSDHTQYLQNRFLESMLLTNVSEREIEKLIESLPNKTSGGVDKISNVLVKKLKYCI